MEQFKWFKWLHNKPTKEQKVLKGAEASSLLAHSLTQEFFERGELQLFQRWRASETADEREAVFKELQGLHAFRGFLTHLCNEKKMIEKESAANS